MNLLLFSTIKELCLIYTLVKHLKLFESTDPLYTPLIHWEYTSNQDKFMGLDTKELSELDELFYPLDVDILQSGGAQIETYSISRKRREYTVIRKLPDDWYFIVSDYIDGYGYRCDQWDGLLYCLKDSGLLDYIMGDSLRFTDKDGNV